MVVSLRQRPKKGPLKSINGVGNSFFPSDITLCNPRQIILVHLFCFWVRSMPFKSEKTLKCSSKCQSSNSVNLHHIPYIDFLPSRNFLNIYVKKKTNTEIVSFRDNFKYMYILVPVYVLFLSQKHFNFFNLMNFLINSFFQPSELPNLDLTVQTV